MRRNMKRNSVLPITAAFFLALCAVVPPEAQGFKPPAHAVLPDYDRRAAAAAQPLAVARAAAVTELRNRVPRLQIDFDEIRGTPSRIAAPDGFLSGTGGEGRAISPAAARALRADDPHRAIKAFLNEHSALFGHGAEILAGSKLKREFVTAHNGLRTFVWEQQLDQIPLFEGLLMGHITKRGELVNLSSQFLPNLQQAADAGTPNRAGLEAAPTISAAEAVLRAARNIGEELLTTAVTPLKAEPDGAERRQKFTAAPLPGEAQVKLVWLPMNRLSLRLCWQ